jgi:choline dehydrogenase-like flavoprotein
MTTTFIVGAGSAGLRAGEPTVGRCLACGVAAARSRRHGHNWIWFHIPVGYLFAIGNPRSDWMFKTEPEAGLNGRSLNYPRGKVIGGSSRSTP